MWHTQGALRLARGSEAERTKGSGAPCTMAWATSAVALNSGGIYPLGSAVMSRAAQGRASFPLNKAGF